MRTAMTPGSINQGALQYARPAASTPQATGPTMQAPATNQWQNRGGAPSMSMQAPTGASGVSGGYGPQTMSMQAPGGYPQAASGGAATPGGQRIPGGVAGGGQGGYSYPGGSMNAGMAGASPAGGAGAGGGQQRYVPEDPNRPGAGGGTSGGGTGGGLYGSTPGAGTGTGGSTGGNFRGLLPGEGSYGPTPGDGNRMLSPIGGWPAGGNFEGSFQNPGGLMSPGNGQPFPGGGTTPSYPGTGSQNPGAGSGGNYSGVDPGYNVNRNQGGGQAGTGAQTGAGGATRFPTGGTGAGYSAYGSGQMNQSTYNPNQPYSPAQMQQIQAGSRPQQSSMPAGGSQPVSQVATQPQANQQQLFTPTGQQGSGAANQGNTAYWQQGMQQSIGSGGIGDPVKGPSQMGPNGKYYYADGTEVAGASWSGTGQNGGGYANWGMGQMYDWNQPGAPAQGQQPSFTGLPTSAGAQKGPGNDTVTSNWQKQQAAKQQGAAGAIAQKPQAPRQPLKLGMPSNPEGESGTGGLMPNEGPTSSGSQKVPTQMGRPESGMSTQGPQDMGQSYGTQQQAQQKVPRPSSDDYQVASGTGFSTPEQVQGAKDRIAAWEAQNQGQQNPNQQIYNQQVQQGQVGYTPWQQGGNFYGLNVGAGDVDWQTKTMGPAGASGSNVQPAPQGNFPGQPYPGAAGTIVNPDGTGTAWNYGSPQNTDTMQYQAWLSAQRQGIPWNNNYGSSSGNSGGGSGGSGGSAGSSGGGSPETGLLIPDLYQKAYEEARKANEDRYNQINAGYEQNYGNAMDWQGRSANNLINQYDERYNRNMDTAAGLGAQELKDIQDRFTAERGSAEANMIDRGIGNTTIRPSVLGGVTRNESDALGGALDRINRLKLQTDMALSGDSLANQQGLHGERLGLMTELPQRQLDFMERRTDSYPDMDQLLNLALRYGNAEGQQGQGGVMYPPNYNGTGQYQVPNPSMPGGGYTNPGGGSTGGGSTGGGSSGGGSNSRPPGGGLGSSNPYPGGSQTGAPLTPGYGSQIPGYKWDPNQNKWVPDPTTGGGTPGTGDSGAPMEPPVTPGLTPPGVTGPTDILDWWDQMAEDYYNSGGQMTPGMNPANSLQGPTSQPGFAAGASGYGDMYDMGYGAPSSGPVSSPANQNTPQPQTNPPMGPMGNSGGQIDWNSPQGSAVIRQASQAYAASHPGMPPLSPQQAIEYATTGTVSGFGAPQAPALPSPTPWRTGDPSGS